MRWSTTRTSPPSTTWWASSMVSTVPPRSTIGRPGSGAVASAVTWLLPFRSRDQHRLRAAGRAALALPGGCDVVERAAVQVDADVAARGVLGEPQVGVALELRRRVGDGVPADVERL